MPKTSDVIINNPQNKNASSLVLAMQGWEKSLDSHAGQAGGQFGRVLKIQTAGLTISNDLDVEGTVPFDDDTEANEAEIKVYNLSRSTIGKLKPNEEITITAGYGTDTGIIFSGVISAVKTKWSGLDKATTIWAIDDIKLKERDIDSISFKTGTKASYILKTLLGKLNLPIAVFKIRKDYVYKEAETVSGNLMAAIRQYAEVCGVSAYVHKRKIYVWHLSDGDNLGFTVTEDTGLVGNPEEYTEEIDNENYTGTINGVKFKMLLEHRISVASIIKMKSREYDGTYRVRSGQHIFNESEFYTEITAIGADAGIGTGTGAGASTQQTSQKSEDTKKQNTWRTDRLEDGLTRDQKDTSIYKNEARANAHREEMAANRSSNPNGYVSAADLNR